MTDEATMDGIPGGRALIDWLGYVTRFHDASLLGMTLNAGGGSSTLRLHTWRMTDKVDDRGYFLLDRHVVVTVTLDAVTYVHVDDFDLPGIIFHLDIMKIDSGFELTWTVSYGVEGTLRAKQVRFDLQPGEP